MYVSAKNWLIGKDSDAGRDWGQEEKGTTENEKVGWHHWLNGRESQWTPGVGDGQGDLACCDSWGRKESDRTEQLIWSGLMVVLFLIFWGTSISFFKVANSADLYYHPKQEFPFLQILANTCYLLFFFDNSHFNKCEMISYCSFDLHFLDD